MERLRAQVAGHSTLPLDREATSLAYLYYPEGGFYRRHVDAPPTPSPTGQHREVSVLLYLDPAWRAEWGGALRIFPRLREGSEEYVDVSPESGTLVLMRSPRIAHQVLETRRRRHAVVGWFCSTGPKPAESAPT